MRKQIGTVSVDAGLIWIGDPCYVLGDDASHRVTNWSDFCDKLYGDNMKDGFSEPLGNGVGVAVSSGYGDGEYPVFAEFSDEGDWGIRVKSITIEFIEDN